MRRRRSLPTLARFIQPMPTSGPSPSAPRARVPSVLFPGMRHAACGGGGALFSFASVVAFPSTVFHARTHARTVAPLSRTRVRAPHTKDPLFTTTMSSGAPSGGVLLLLFFPFFFFFFSVSPLFRHGRPLVVVFHSTRCFKIILVCSVDSRYSYYF